MAGTSGCTLLDLLLGNDLPPFSDGSFPIPTASATFSAGSATIKLADETIVLDALAGSAGIDPDLGIHVSWENDEGWYVSYYAYPDEGFGSSSAYLTLDRINDHEHWVVADPTRCLTTTTQSGASGVQGTSTCRGLRWSDFIDAYSGTRFPRPIASEPPFDAEIAFEAH